MKGKAVGLSNAIRHTTVASTVAIGAMFFNGSIVPVALVILAVSLLIIFLAFCLEHYKKATVKL